MKNMKVSRKLLVSFIIVIVLAVAVGAVGIVGMSQLNNAQDQMYVSQTEPLTYISNLTTVMQRMRISLREYEIGVFKQDSTQIENAYNATQDYIAQATENFDAFDATIASEEIRVLFDEARLVYNAEFRVALEDTYKLATAGDFEGVDRILYATGAGSAVEAINKVVANLDQCLAIKVQLASEANNAGDALFRMLLLTVIAVLAIAVVIALFLATYISSLISKPLVPLQEFMEHAGATGDITLNEHDRQVIGSYGQRKDEIGQTIASCAALIARINDVSKALEIVASGDLTAELDVLSEKDVLGVSLDKMTENLNTMFGEINTASAQVSTGSSQVADGAQALASGSTQQAATVEELSSSIAEIAEKTKTNAERAGDAARMADVIKGNAEKGSQQMNDMIGAVREINDSSRNISKVIKVIDDIAFQTNILALNAAVEAARAGQHGKGFAVVAEEVRNLAAKSAEAAKNTETLIASSTEKAEFGVRIAEETSVSLSEIVSGIGESNIIISEIATSSEEQSSAISQINMGIDQVAQVVQQNSATAQESAAASEEMSSQSAMLQQLVAQFKTKGADDKNTNNARRQALPAAQLSPRVKQGNVIF